MKTLVALTLLVSVSFCAQPYPGTNKRPILSTHEATYVTKTTYLQGWNPPAILTSRADYTVGKNQYSTIQGAVNAAIEAGGTTRKYIEITAGTYDQIVYIPPTDVPITLYGAGKDASSTVISSTLSATITGSAYISLVGDFFKSGDPGYSMYLTCAGKAVIGTSCSTVVWIKAPNVQITNLTIQNLSKKTGTDQAVALYTQADMTQVSKCRLLGHQDTFWSGSTGNTISRGHVTDTYIEGDIDFVFGGGSTVFERCVFYAKSDRHNSAVVFAPATAPTHEYGYLVIGSKITGDNRWSTSKAVRLARAWDAGVASLGDYVVGISPNGQLVVRESTIDDILPSGAPYNPATSKRPYSGNANGSRDLNNNHYNRFWEYANTGNGA